MAQRNEIKTAYPPEVHGSLRRYLSTYHERARWSLSKPSYDSRGHLTASRQITAIADAFVHGFAARKIIDS